MNLGILEEICGAVCSVHFAYSSLLLISKEEKAEYEKDCLDVHGAGDDCFHGSNYLRGEH